MSGDVELIRSLDGAMAVDLGFIPFSPTVYVILGSTV
jgi:hypothetical protein